jgi:hypothetical protein
MMHGHVNYLAVLVATIADMIVGFVWYSPGAFGNVWTKIIGKGKVGKTEREKMQKEVRPYLVIMFVVTFISAAVLARFIVWLGVATLEGGLRIGFFAWLGFALPFATGDALFSGRDKSLVGPMFLVQAGHHLVGLLVMGAILGVWL